MYVRSSDALDHITVRLLCAKSKVAPLKTSTIPRLELCGAVLAARLCNKVTDSLRWSVDKTYFWCDSNVVLGWLNTPPHKLSAFVSHRVAEVNDLCADSSVWMYVPSALNPADLASRGVYPDEVSNLSLWWDGPTYLKCAKDQWPDQRTYEKKLNLPEVRVHFSNINANPKSIIDFDRYSSFIKLRRILAYVYRFIDITRSKVKSIGPLTVDELDRSESKLAQFSQLESFSIYKNNFKTFPAMHCLMLMKRQVSFELVGGYTIQNIVLINGIQFYCMGNIHIHY